jgi:hypothetical protein
MTAMGTGLRRCGLDEMDAWVDTTNVALTPPTPCEGLTCQSAKVGYLCVLAHPPVLLRLFYAAWSSGSKRRSHSLPLPFRLADPASLGGRSPERPRAAADRLALSIRLASDEDNLSGGAGGIAGEHVSE